MTKIGLNSKICQNRKNMEINLLKQKNNLGFAEIENYNTN